MVINGKNVCGVFFTCEIDPRYSSATHPIYPRPATCEDKILPEMSRDLSHSLPGHKKKARDWPLLIDMSLFLSLRHLLPNSLVVHTGSEVHAFLVQ